MSPEGRADPYPYYAKARELGRRDRLVLRVYHTLPITLGEGR